MDEKKLLVFSDTHGSVSLLKKVFDWAADHLPPKDTLCGAAFCGDGIDDLKSAASAAGFYCDWKLVGGNNDYGHSTPDSAVFEFGGHRFFMCHGHRYSIYTGFSPLVAAARTNEAEAVLFGHAHIPIKKNENGILIINPGSLGRPRSNHGSTFAVVSCTDKLDVEFYGVSSYGKISKVKM